MIFSELSRNSGFFSQFFFAINHYIHAVKTNQNFRLITDNWLFKYKEGWTDYFLPIDINDRVHKDNEEIIHAFHGNTLANYKLIEYKLAIQSMYHYNTVISELVKKSFLEFGLKKNEYGGIFIRRGDKLVAESHYNNASKYLKRLLVYNNSINTVYVQTDDYNVILELKEYVLENGLNLSIVTNCPVDCRGLIIFDFYKTSLLHGNVLDNNKDYIINKCDFNLVKPVSSMNPEEIYEHTKRMLVGIELIRNAIHVVTDYESNIGRFIKLSMSDEKVESIMDIEKDEPDYEKVINPSYAFRD